MKWKEFLKPTAGKIILFIALMGVLNYIVISSTVILDARILVGIPLGFYPVGGFYMFPGAPEPPIVEFSYLNFIIDLVFWYLVSCTLVAWYKNPKRLSILAFVFSFILIFALTLFLFVNLMSGTWGFMPNPILTILIVLLPVGIYIYFLRKYKLFDFSSK